MPRVRSIPFCLTLLAGILSVNSNAANEPPALQVNSTHFTVITDAGEKKGRELAFRFEQMRSVFAGLLGKDRLNQSVPLTILALKNDKAYYQVAPLKNGQPIDVSGFFVGGEDQEPLEIDLFRSLQQSSGSDSDPPRPDRINEKTLLRVAVPDLLFGAGAAVPITIVFGAIIGGLWYAFPLLRARR